MKLLFYYLFLINISSLSPTVKITAGNLAPSSLPSAVSIHYQNFYKCTEKKLLLSLFLFVILISFFYYLFRFAPIFQTSDSLNSITIYYTISFYNRQIEFQRKTKNILHVSPFLKASHLKQVILNEIPFYDSSSCKITVAEEQNNKKAPALFSIAENTKETIASYLKNHTITSSTEKIAKQSALNLRSFSLTLSVISFL